MRPLEVALKSGLFKRVIVSTDSEEVAEVVKGFAIVEWRDPRLCEDHVTDMEVVRDIAERHNDADYLCYLYATAALVTVEQMRYGLDFMIRSRRPIVYCAYDDTGLDAGQFYWYDFGQMLADDMMDELSIPIHIDHMQAQDINTLEDFELAEMKARWSV